MQEKTITLPVTFSATIFCIWLSTFWPKFRRLMHFYESAHIFLWWIDLPRSSSHPSWELQAQSTHWARHIPFFLYFAHPSIQYENAKFDDLSPFESWAHQQVCLRLPCMRLIEDLGLSRMLFVTTASVLFPLALTSLPHYCLALAIQSILMLCCLLFCGWGFRSSKMALAYLCGITWVNLPLEFCWRTWRIDRNDQRKAVPSSLGPRPAHSSSLGPKVEFLYWV